MKHLLALPLAMMLANTALAEAPVIHAVEATYGDMGWRFDVTLEHPDSGWDHYADGWEITDAAGNQIGYRELMHPHVDEQPFTRSLRNVMLADGVTSVFIRARCSDEGWSNERYEVTLSR
ncbi:hypothetical protein KO498_06790 [Lentibacter algarum]|uniref:hypothetical protein n=1 Tax=Lentibacter algarum TaxID=576131 RepID=UPI001C06C6A3|nr:hypothetical protein [Lentibacter algarum]MBU2981519.1 hypothetical protein [Lentibacter algarum]